MNEKVKKKIGIVILAVVCLLVGIFLWIGKSSNNKNPNLSNGNSLISAEEKDSNGYK